MTLALAFSVEVPRRQSEIGYASSIHCNRAVATATTVCRAKGP
jgi:hypothetical protein